MPGQKNFRRSIFATAEKCYSSNLYPDGMDAFNIFRTVRRCFEFPAKVADMVVDSLAGIVIKSLMPYEVYNHFIGEYTLGVHDQQGEYVKLLYGQFDFLPADRDNSLFQAKVQITLL